MFFELTEEQKNIRQLARDFTEKRISVVQAEDEKDHIFRREVVSEMGKLGLLGTVLPEEYGGSDVGFLSTVLIVEEIARVSASYSTYSMTQGVGPGLVILKYGTNEHKDKYLPALSSGELLACFAATEPDVGSDVTSIKTTAVEKGDYYIVNGVKAWITNGPVADMGLFWFKTDTANSREGISCFIVDLKSTPGISTNPYDKLGLWCTVTGEVAFDDARIPKECLLGPKGKGRKILLEMLGNTRLFAAARAVGVGQACLEDSIKYAKERKQFGRPIAEFQMIQGQIAEMYIEHEAAKMLVYQTAANKDRGIQDITEVAVAKYFACESGVKAADLVLRIYSSYGFSMDFPVQRYVRDSRAFTVTEGTSNIQKVIIARSLLR
ncbi:acyl-CoA dehydrogenase family protein [Chloroflexota bacterium]